MHSDRALDHLLHLLNVEGYPFRFALAICAIRFATTEHRLELLFYRSR